MNRRIYYLVDNHTFETSVVSILSELPSLRANLDLASSTKAQAFLHTYFNQKTIITSDLQVVTRHETNEGEEKPIEKTFVYYASNGFKQAIALVGHLEVQPDFELFTVQGVTSNYQSVGSNTSATLLLTKNAAQGYIERSNKYSDILEGVAGNFAAIKNEVLPDKNAASLPQQLKEKAKNPTQIESLGNQIDAASKDVVDKIKRNNRDTASAKRLAIAAVIAFITLSVGFIAFAGYIYKIYIPGREASLQQEVVTAKAQAVEDANKELLVKIKERLNLNDDQAQNLIDTGAIPNSLIENIVEANNLSALNQVGKKYNSWAAFLAANPTFKGTAEQARLIELIHSQDQYKQQKINLAFSVIKVKSRFSLSQYQTAIVNNLFDSLLSVKTRYNLSNTELDELFTNLNSFIDGMLQSGKLDSHFSTTLQNYTNKLSK